MPASPPQVEPPLGKAPSLQHHPPCCPVLPIFAPCRPSLQAPSQAATTTHSGTSTRAIRAFGALGAFQGARWCAEEARGRAGLRAWGRRTARRRELGWGTTTGPPLDQQWRWGGWRLPVSTCVLLPQVGNPLGGATYLPAPLRRCLS